jgi:hypothetical protein
MGPLTDIDEEGFMSPAFHSFPDMLKPDPVSGDNGPNLFGHVWNTATYVVNHPQFGWVAFGANLKVEGGTVSAAPLDSARSRIYIAPLGLWLTLESGRFDRVEFNTKTRTVRVGLSPADQFTSTARLRIEQPAKIISTGEYRPTTALRSERGAFVVPLTSETAWVELNDKH